MQAQFRLLFAGALVAGAFAGIVSTAHAQVTPVERPFRIKLGGLFPTDNSVSDRVGNYLFSYGVGYDFGKTTATAPTVYSFYLDGATRSRGDDRLTYNGIGVGLRRYFTPALLPTRFYAGAGIGGYLVNSRRANDSNNDFKFGGKLLAGAELNGGLFGEVDYTLISSVKGYTPQGFNVSLGYRF